MNCLKSRLTLSAILLTVAPLGAQTNTFPSSGNVGIGTTNPGTNLLHLYYGASGGVAYNAGGLVVESSGRSSIQLLSPNSSDSYLFFGDASSANKGYVGQTGSTASPANMMHYYSAGGHSFSGGNVGVGTTSPSYKFEVNGVVASSGATNQYLIAQTTAGSGTNAAIEIKGGALNADWLIGTNRGDIWGTGDALAFYKNAGSYGAKMVLQDNGNVGIGTTTPRRTLDIESGSYGGDMIDGSGTGQLVVSASGRAGINILSPSNSQGYLTFGNPTTFLSGYMEYDSNNSGFWKFQNNGNFGFMGGNVGIGTTNPTQKLSVNGTIQAKEVVVQTGWSDYVFDKSYKLGALSETEAYIKAEHHLPGIPSAQEVAEHGVGMGEMQSKFLAKIEELTLHQIEQEKRLNDAYGRLQKLEAENAALRAGHHN